MAVEISHFLLYDVKTNQMQPNKTLIKIKDTEKKIEQMLQELVFQPRLKAIEWSRLTLQTPNMKIGYPGQHLVSLITGMTGERSGARGNDLIDGSEVKSCSRIDQVDTCLECGLPVARLETECANCNSQKIKRNNDSKWLFTIRSESDLDTLTNKVNRVILVIGYYPDFDNGNYDNVRISAYEIWPKNPRQLRFAEIMTNYYQKIYSEHRRLYPTKTPAPKNFWPFQYQFYICNPIEVFTCDIKNINVNPELEIVHHVAPDQNRENLPSVSMPPQMLSVEEFVILKDSAKKSEIEKCLKKGADFATFESALIAGKKKILHEMFAEIDERLRSYLPLRDTDKISTSKNKYERRTY